jgi:hypothetical protein
MTELERNSDYEYMDNFARRKNASFEYNNFVQAIKAKSNQAIENTKVYELLELLLSSKNCVCLETLPKGKHLFRGRRMNIDECLMLNKIQVDDDDFIHGFDKYDSKEPPLTVPTSGRNNISGMSYLYLAAERYTACAEIKPIRGTEVSLATFKTNRALKAFNLSDNVNVKEYKDFGDKHYLSVPHLLTLIMQAFYSPVYDREGYAVTQYISDLVRKHGFDALGYRSYISQGKNYTVFNCCESNISFVSSEIVYVGQQLYDFRKINSGKKLKRPTASNPNFEERIRRIKNYIFNSTRHFNSIK